MKTKVQMQLRQQINKGQIVSRVTSKLTLLFLSLSSLVLTQGNGAVSLRSHLRRRTACTATRRPGGPGTFPTVSRLPHNRASTSFAFLTFRIKLCAIRVANFGFLPRAIHLRRADDPPASVAHETRATGRIAKARWVLIVKKTSVVHGDSVVRERCLGKCRITAEGAEAGLHSDSTSIMA